MTNKPKLALIYQKEYFEYLFDKKLSEEFELFTQYINLGTQAEDLDELVDFNADINIVFRGEFFPTQTLTKLKGIKVAISTEPFPKIIDSKFNYTLDSILRFRNFLPVFDKDFDYIFHYDQVSASFLKGQGIDLSGYFPLPIATNDFMPIPCDDYEWDICFIGRSTEHREKYLGALKSHFKLIHIAHGLEGTEMLPYISRSKININLHAEPEISWEPRTQLLLACGTVMISEPISPNNYLEKNKDYIEIGTREELYNKCADILQNYEAYDDYKINGRAKIVNMLSSLNNFTNLTHDVLAGKYQKPNINRSKINLNALEICKKYNGLDHLLLELAGDYEFE